MTAFDFEKKKRKISDLEKESEKESFWKNQESAQNILKELENLKQEVADFSDLKEEIASLEEILDLSKDDKRIEKEIVENLQEIEKKVRKFEFNILFSGEYDDRNAILSIHRRNRWSRCPGLDRDAS